MNTINAFPLNNCVVKNDYLSESCQFNHGLFEAIKFAKLIEKGQLKIFKDKKRNVVNSQIYILIELLRRLSHLKLPLDSSIQLNPYLQLLTEEATNPIHSHYFSGLSNFSEYEYIFALIERLTAAFTKSKCALASIKFNNELTLQTSDLKKAYDKLLKKHQQINCCFIEIPFLELWKPIAMSNEIAESQLIKTVKNFLKSCHSSHAFAKKLCDIQWRFIENLNGLITAQILVYVIGDENNYQTDFFECWRAVCTKSKLNIHHQNIVFSTYHSYQGNGVANKQWKNRLDSSQASLHLYHQKSKSLSYLWRSYTGNV